MDRRVICVRIPTFEIALARLEDPALRRRPVAIASVCTRGILREVSSEAIRDGLSPGIEVDHARLEMEIALIRPEVVVCLGKTAAEAVLERPVRLRLEQGTFKEMRGVPVFVTIHPSALLRFEEPEEQEREYARFVNDLRQVKKYADAAGRRTTAYS